MSDWWTPHPGLALVGPTDKERDYLQFLGSNAGSGPTPVLRSCADCHQDGIDSVRSYRRLQPPAQFVTPR
jgi:hypothetical protein